MTFVVALALLMAASSIGRNDYSRNDYRVDNLGQGNKCKIDMLQMNRLLKNKTENLENTHNAARLRDLMKRTSSRNEPTYWYFCCMSDQQNCNL